MRAVRTFPLLAVLVAVLAIAPGGRASFAGANGELFVVGRAPDTADPGHLYSVDPDGGNLTQLTRGDADDEFVRVSPDGGSLLVSRDTGEQCGHLYWAQGVDLFTLDTAGGSQTRLTDNCPMSDSTPAWSPSGAHIVFSRVGDLWSMRPDGSDLAELTCNPPDGGDYTPAWSPDGRTIAFDHLGDVELMAADGSNVRFVAHGSVPSFSPDGTKLAYGGPSFSPAQGVHVLDLATGNDVRLTSGDDSQPVWSPDGTKLAYIAHTQSPQRDTLTVMDGDGSNAAPVTHSLNVSNVDWGLTAGATTAREPNVTAADTACVESPPAIQLPSDSDSGANVVDVASVQPPDRLVAAQVAFSPTVLRSRASFTLTIVIRTLAGREVKGAAVRATSLTGAARATAQVLTDSSGTARLRVVPTRRLRLVRDGRLVLAVHLRRPGAPWTGDIAGLRLVSVRTARSA
jgi:hypothetical protein